ncbi:hypothetical protein F7725_008772 [Dissostichus mawsoni]|uniref:Uncharacterized protein n=1 Tax=Dissostichus mawsoni TaxID=36200 RepID=A0A7J5YA11_DISMA|nr:hypothetical protein F7725_008772 [Dissostichus mawsoni]
MNLYAFKVNKSSHIIYFFSFYVCRHADGSIKFWDASALMLQMLYKLKTAKVFERSRRSEEKGGSEMVDEDPFAIQTLSWCPESRMLCVAGVSAHIIIYRFSKQEVTTDTLQVGGRTSAETSTHIISFLSHSEMRETHLSHLSRACPPSSPQEADAPPQTPNSDGPRDNKSCLQVRSSPLKQSPGFQVELVVQLLWVSGEPPQPITSLARGVWEQQRPRCVDFLQKTLLLNMGISDLCNPADPHLRQPRSPRKTRHTSTDSVDGSNTSEDRCKSPTSEVNASFSRSRSSSVSSLDRESREVISSLSFCESFPRKGDASLGPSLLLGTSMGSVIMVALSLPPPGETRLQQPVGVAPCGSLETLKAGILTMALLDSSGSLLPPPSEQWYDPNGSEEDQREKRRRRPPSPPPSVEGQDSQFLVLVSEKQAKVLALPSQSRLHKHSISESSFVLRADVVTLGGGNCIACFCANGHIMTLRYNYNNNNTQQYTDTS